MEEAFLRLLPVICHFFLSQVFVLAVSLLGYHYCVFVVKHFESVFPKCTI